MLWKVHVHFQRPSASMDLPARVSSVSIQTRTWRVVSLKLFSDLSDDGFLPLPNYIEQSWSCTLVDS